MRGNMSVILEGIKEEFNGEQKINESSEVNEGWGEWAKCDSNIDNKKFDDLCKTTKKYGYKLTDFHLTKYRSAGGIQKFINLSPEDSRNDMIPYITFDNGKFYTHPRLMADFDDVGIKSFIKFLERANDLCNILNKTKFEDFMTADHPE